MTDCQVCELIERIDWIGDPNLSHCRVCHRSWTGHRAGHCMACHAHFSSESGFRRHRVDGACVDPAERGLIERERGWGFPGDGGHAERHGGPTGDDGDASAA